MVTMLRTHLVLAQPSVAVSAQKRTPARAATKRSQPIIESDDDDEDMELSKVGATLTVGSEYRGLMLWHGVRNDNMTVCSAGISTARWGRRR